MKREEEQKIEKIEKEVESIIDFNEYDRAHILSKNIEGYIEEDGFKAKFPDLYKKYRKIKTRLEWVCLFMFNEKKVLSFFDGHFQYGLDLLDYDFFSLWEKLRPFLLSRFPLLEERDNFKTRLIDILNQNKAYLTSKKLSNNNGPSVKNWIKIYTGKIGLKSADSLEFRNFFTSNNDYKKLNEKEKVRVEKFFKFYERLKKSSFNADGIEDNIPIDTDNFKGAINDGEIIKYNRLDAKAEKILKVVMEDRGDIEQNGVEEEKNNENIDGIKNKDLDQLFEMREHYPHGSLERRAIDEEIKKLESNN
ncbi:hypothetical protein K8R62_02100 [bacterium]|nr:hypothetical protein [bacterium]